MKLTTFGWTFFIVLAFATGCLGLKRLVKKSPVVPSLARGVDSSGPTPDYRTVTVHSTDGVALNAGWAPAKGRSQTAVLVHAWGDSKESPYVKEAARVYDRAGFNVLALDLRGQGGSEGPHPTAGYQEVRDVRGALRWLVERGIQPEETVLHGWSTGAATVVRAAPGTGVGAVVEEAAYANLPLLLCNMIPGGRAPSNFLAWLSFLVSKLVGVDFDPWALRPEEDAAQLHKEEVALFIIHSVEDKIVPFKHATLLSAANPDATFWKVEDRWHIEACTHPDYRRRLLDFLDNAGLFHEELAASKISGVD